MKTKTFELVKLGSDYAPLGTIGRGPGSLCARELIRIFPAIRSKKRIWVTVSSRPVGPGGIRVRVDPSCCTIEIEDGHIRPMYLETWKLLHRYTNKKWIAFVKVEYEVRG